MSAPSVLLALRGRLGPVRTWARHGLLPVWIIPDVAWTLVVPAGPPASSPPYDDPVSLLGGRRLPVGLRPSIALVTEADRAVVVVHEKARRAQPRWLVWEKSTGLAPSGESPHAPLGLVGGLAGLGTQHQRDALRAAVAPDEREAADVVDDLVRALGLPGAGLPIGALYAGELPGAVRVDPDEKVVARFDHFVAQEAELAAQLDDPR